jgi:hypothetical protein
MFAELTATGAECEMFAEKLRKISRCYFLLFQLHLNVNMIFVPGFKSNVLKYSLRSHEDCHFLNS